MAVGVVYVDRSLVPGSGQKTIVLEKLDSLFARPYDLVLFGVFFGDQYGCDSAAYKR